MSDKCTRRLIRNWALLIVPAGEFAVLVFWLIAGHVPATNLININGYVHWELPASFPRWVDPFVLVLLVALGLWACFHAAELGQKTGVWSTDGVVDDLGWGTSLGLLGSLMILWGGFLAVGIGTVITGTILSICCLIKGHDRGWRLPLLTWTGVLAIWILNTVYQGSVAGLLYACATLLVATLVHWLWVFVWRAAPVVARQLQRTFLTCSTE